ncbi:MAG: YbaN family protein [Planctomycetia bacterium]
MDLRPVSDPLRSLLYVAGGWLFVGLAVVGAVLPLVPSTPFLLLASWCFYRGSPRIHAWLHRSRHFGPMLDDWEYYHGVRRTTKRTAVLTILAVVATSLLLNSLPWWLRYVALAMVAVGLSVIWTVPTLPDDAPRAPRTSAQ